MYLRTLLAAVLALGVLAAAPVAQTTYLPLDQVRPGMIGVGRTVFSGTKLEDFKVEVLGVMRNVIGPKRNLILARLEGGPLAKTGVIAGMSGSPVYIDGKLMGAVSYSLGQFSTEPIAGITPIAEMIDATHDARRDAGDASGRDVGAADAARAAGDLVARSRPREAVCRRAVAGAGAVGRRRRICGRMSAMLRPIAVPMIASGFDASVFDPISPALVGRRLRADVERRNRPAPACPPPTTRPLQPGDAVGVALLTGDFELGATGTVTHVDGDRVYAFGHPLYNLGPTQFPMTRAEVQVVLPSLMASSKLASFGEVVGTVQQDRATAIAGRLGPAPSLIPVTITLNSDRGPSRTFNFGVVRDFTFTPLLTYLSVANVLTSYERGAGPASFAIRGSASIRSEGDLSFEDIFSGDQPAGGAAAYVAGPLTALLKNSGENVEVEKIALTIDASEQQRSARIERVWLDTTRPRAGQRCDRERRAAIGPRPGNRAAGADPDSGEPDRLAAADRRRCRPHDRGRSPRHARRRPAARVADDARVQSGAPQQPPVRPAHLARFRRGRQRRADGRPAAVGAGRDGSRSQQRHGRIAAHDDARRMGAGPRLRRDRIAPADPFPRPTLMTSIEFWRRPRARGGLC